MQRKLKAVKTSENGTKLVAPHEIVSGADKLDAIDMPYFHKVSEAFDRARRLQMESQQAAIEAQGISNAFLAVVKEKYGLTERDSIAQSGQIMRAKV